MTNASILAGLIFGLAILSLLIVFLFSVVRYALDKYFYFPFALTYCRRRGLIPIKWRCASAYYDGIKTEFTIVEVLCSDGNDLKSLVRLLVWIFGVKKVLDGNAPLDERSLEVSQT
jgi:hypothetical protein